jgi:ATP-dependent Clp protease adapter protein ClpS
VVGLFSARGYNIESLTVAPTEDASLSRMTIVTTGSDEVIEQILIATSCSYEHAERCTLEVHHTGKAVVFHGELDACLRVSAVLEEIALHTQLEM